MIYTFTPNPALDLEYQVNAITIGAIHRSEPARADWGGKGFNVSRVLKVLGEESIAVGFAAGYTGKRLEKGLNQGGIRTELVWLFGETRTNISVVGKTGGGYLKVNEPGPEVDPESAEQMLTRIKDLTRPDDLWIFSGSLPPGLASNFYAAAIRLVKACSGRAFLDTSGAALCDGCAACPDLVKPNAEEARELSGMAVSQPNQALMAAREIVRLGPAQVIVSLGEMGAVAYGDGKGWHARPLAVQAANPVGAGDALVAGLAAGWTRGWSLSEMLRLGMACGASAARQAGTGIGTREEIDRFFCEVATEAF